MCSTITQGALENVDSQAPRPASESIGQGAAQALGILRLSLDITAQHLLSHLGKQRPGRAGDLSDLVDQAVGKPGLKLGAPSLSFLSFPSSSLALCLLVTQGSESSCGTTEETSEEKQSQTKPPLIWGTE